jgi:hypothetical protein
MIEAQAATKQGGMEPLPLRLREPAPPFAVEDTSGRVSITLDTYRHRQELLLVFLHGPGCAFCTTIAQELDAHKADTESWGVGLLLLTGAREEFPNLSVQQGVDESRAALGRYAPGRAADVVIACLDRRGHFLEGWSLTHPTAVDWREVMETVRWAAIQVPECGTCNLLPEWEVVFEQHSFPVPNPTK